MNSVLVFQRDGWGTTLVSGPDRKSWLNGLLTCDVEAVGPGRGAWGLVLTRQGKVRSDLELIEGEAGIYVACPRENVELLNGLLEEHLIMEDAEHHVVDPPPSWFMLVGDGARRIASELDVALAWGEMVWPPLTGALLVVPPELEHEALDHAAQLGAEHAGPDAWERLRIEHGLPAFGVDYGPDDNPHQASLEPCGER
jgi:folate-binding Fe-S cluster repair protein YgfZ